jgi:hypothetical protein
VAIIFLSKHVYDNLSTANPKPKYIAHLAHEQTHLRRQKEMGLIRFIFKYLTSPQFRFYEELEAIKEQIKVYKEHNIQFDIEKSAKSLSGHLYFWAVSYKYAERELENAWKSLQKDT